MEQFDWSEMKYYNIIIYTYHYSEHTYNSVIIIPVEKEITSSVETTGSMITFPAATIDSHKIFPLTSTRVTGMTSMKTLWWPPQPGLQ